MTSLFDPFTLKGVTLRNRIAVAPMCQYSAENGVPNQWHLVHLAGLARGGAGLVVVEATAVERKGRITHGCTGLWDDAQIVRSRTYTKDRQMRAAYSAGIRQFRSDKWIRMRARGQDAYIQLEKAEPLIFANFVGGLDEKLYD